jgi:hypothetical protein
MASKVPQTGDQKKTRGVPVKLGADGTVPPALTGEAVAVITALHRVGPDSAAAPDPETRQEMVATAAYYCAEQRGFTPGHELEDWLAAEAAVDAMLTEAERH